jgi:glycosyltransferase involved in cell wall biosynthesis/lysophospholipase L1-like esterase
MTVSVVICTRNPRPEVFARVLRCLATQTLPGDRWEAIVVDNGSRPRLAVAANAGLANVRAVVEPVMGLVHARIRGIREATGDLLVFVDDDNLLDADYLEQAARIAGEFPRIGAFGGRISPEFEAEEPAWLRPFRGHLAIVDFPRDEWANSTGDGAVLPCGAGLCVRRSLADRWAASVAADPARLALGRSGGHTLACEDTDLVLSCADAGWGTGRFTSLHLTHVIPAERLGFDYQQRLAADIGFSYGRLRAIRGETSRGRRVIAAVKTMLAFLGVTHRGNARRLDVAYHRGYQRGLTSRRWSRAWLTWVALGVPLLALACGEGFARLWLGLGDPPLSVADPDIEYLFKPGEYHRFGNTIRINSHHMRSDEMADTKSDPRELRVLVMGDSVINGGGLTDQRDLATEILRTRLAAETGRPVAVGNVSAGSWGPGNLLAYVRKFGLFDADMVFIVLNSDDVGDNPTGRPLVGVDPAFPDRSPPLAIVEGFSRYLLPRLRAGGRPGAVPPPAPAAEPPGVSAEAAERSFRDLAALVERVRAACPMVIIVLSPKRGEAMGAGSPGRDAIRRFAAETGLRLIDVSDAFGEAIGRGEDPYRPGDPIHPNELGQRLIAGAILPILLGGITSPIPPANSHSLHLRSMTP